MISSDQKIPYPIIISCKRTFAEEEDSAQKMLSQRGGREKGQKSRGSKDAWQGIEQAPLNLLLPSFATFRNSLLTFLHSPGSSASCE